MLHEVSPWTLAVRCLPLPSWTVQQFVWIVSASQLLSTATLSAHYLVRFRYTVMGLFYFSAELYSIIRKRETDMVVKRYYNFLVAAKRFVNEVNCRQLCADKSKRMLKYI